MKAKKIIISTILFISLGNTSFSNGFYENYRKNYDKIILNTIENKNLDIITYHNTNFINVGVLSREMGLNVSFEKPTVTIKDDKNFIKISVGDVNLIKNDKIHLMYDEPFIKNDRVYVPLRTVCEVLGYTVDYKKTDTGYRTITINTSANNEVIGSDSLLKFDLSPSKRFGIASNQTNEQYISENESPYPNMYVKRYLKDFKTGLSYKLEDSLIGERHIFTKDDKLILFKKTDGGIKYPNLSQMKTEFLVLNPSSMKIIQEKVKIKTAKYDEENDILYYLDEQSNYIKYDLKTLYKTKINKQIYEDIKYVYNVIK